VSVMLTLYELSIGGDTYREAAFQLTLALKSATRRLIFTLT